MLARLASFFVCVLFLSSLVDAQSSLVVSNALGSNMVLQRSPAQARIWGWASPASIVLVTLDNTSALPVTTSADGSWQVFLPPTEASTTPHVLQISSPGQTTITLSNILFGDVYVCSGQSNMQFVTSDAFNASQAIEEANNYPNIRVFTVGQGNVSSTPLNQFASIEQGWSVASNATIGGGDWTYFSAVCWFFVKELYDTQNVPIGAISTNWGGTIIEAWSSADALAACPSTAADEERLEITRSQLKPVNGPNPNVNTVLWNAMIVPLLPMRIRGAAWYQAESNVGQPIYACRFPAMIQDWRAKWNLSPEEFGFYFVQLAAYTNVGDPLADMRLYQTTALELPYVGMATAMDLGDLGSPQGNIHPRDKQDVGHRLALHARQQIYGENTLLVSGPSALIAFLITPSPNITVLVTFFEDTINPPGGENGVLVIRPDVVCPPSLNATFSCGFYDIFTSDGVWHNTTDVSTTPDGQGLLIRVNVESDLLVPYGVRYAYGEWPVANLYNSGGLPALPFTLPITTDQ